MRKQGRGTRTPQRVPRITVRYTVRDIPADVDRALRRRANEEGKSLNQVLRAALIKEAGGESAAPILHHDLDPLAGTWDDDPEVERVLAEQDHPR